MNDMNIILVAIGFTAGSIVGGVVWAFLASRRPAEKTLALKALTKAIEWVGRLNTASPEQAAALAAEAAKEAALITAAKDAALKL